MTIISAESVGVLKDPHEVYSTREERFWVDFADGTRDVLTRCIALRFHMSAELRLRLLRGRLSR